MLRILFNTSNIRLYAVRSLITYTININNDKRVVTLSSIDIITANCQQSANNKAKMLEVLSNTKNVLRADKLYDDDLKLIMNKKIFDMSFDDLKMIRDCATKLAGVSIEAEQVTPITIVGFIYNDENITLDRIDDVFRGKVLPLNVKLEALVW